MSAVVAGMSGARKTAILLTSLGTDRAAALLRRMDEAEVEEVLREIAELGEIEAGLVDEVIAEFARSANQSGTTLSGGVEMARELLGSIEPDLAAHIVERMPAMSDALQFEYLLRVEPRLAANFLVDEQAQVIAVVLSNLPSELAANLLMELPDEFRREVAVRIATLDRTSPEVVQIIDRHLAARFATITVDDQMEMGGVPALVALLSRSDDETEKAVVEGLAQVDEMLAEKVRAALFSFEDLITLPDRAVQQILRGVDTKDLALALKGASEGVTTKLLGNLSQRAAETLREEVELLGRVRSSEVEAARGSVLKVVRDLEGQGQIVIERSGGSGGDDFVD